MTTVVAAALDGVVVMAADSMTNVYDRPMPAAATKIRRLKIGESGEALLAFCGAGGLTNAADHITIDTEPDASDDEDVRRWASAITHAIDDWAREIGLTDNNLADGTVLLGWNGRLWTLSNAQAIPHLDGRAALGSGEGPAIGALDVLLETRDLHPVEAVTWACSVGVSRDRFSGLPIQVEILPAVDSARGSGAPSPAPEPLTNGEGGS